MRAALVGVALAALSLAACAAPVVVVADDDPTSVPDSGEWIVVGEGAFLVRGSYTHGAKEGEWTTRHPDGSVAAFGRYQRGKRVGEWEFRGADGVSKTLTYEPPGTLVESEKWLYAAGKGECSDEDFEARVRGLEVHFERCFDLAAGQWAGEIETQVEIAADGQVTRVSTERETPPAAPALKACLADLFYTLDFPASGRQCVMRWPFDYGLEPPS